MNIALIACSKSKNDISDIPERVYSKSSLNKYSVLYSKKYLDDYYFLSAKYKFLEKNKIIEKYELTLNNFSYIEREEWSNTIYTSILTTIPKKSNIYILAGKNYYNLFEDKLHKDYNVIKLFENLKGIGYILEFLKKEVNDQRRLF
jgi:hypothetical protein